MDSRLQAGVEKVAGRIRGVPDGTGPFWGGGPGAGRRLGTCALSQSKTKDKSKDKDKDKEEEQKESHMEPRLQAGIELTLEKMAAEQAANSPLTKALNRTIQKIAEDQGVEQQAAGSQGSAPADAGYETRNKSFGKGTTDTDYDKKKAKEETGKVVNLNGKGNVTSEASGIGDKKAAVEGGGTEKKASANARILRTMLGGLV